MSAAQLSSSEKENRFNVGKAVELGLILPVVALFVSLGQFVLAALFNGLFELWLYWAFGALLSVAVWLGGVVLAVFCLVRTGSHRRSGSVRAYSVAGLIISLFVCWAPLLPLVMIGFSLSGFSD